MSALPLELEEIGLLQQLLLMELELPHPSPSRSGCTQGVLFERGSGAGGRFREERVWGRVGARDRRQPGSGLELGGEPARVRGGMKVGMGLRGSGMG